MQAGETSTQLGVVAQMIGVASRDDVKRALAYQRANPETCMGDALVMAGNVPVDGVRRALAKQASMRGGSRSFDDVLAMASFAAATLTRASSKILRLIGEA